MFFSMKRFEAMKPAFAFAVAALAALSCAHSQTATALKRIPLAAPAISPDKTVNHVQVTRLEFAPGQITGRHLHPVPVVGYVESGAFLVQIEGQPQRRYAAGEVVYEPANTPIERYDNESSTASAVLIAEYLAGADDSALITMLPPR
jgi:quercetin dioxygenase-like cupin family protein